MFEKGSRGNPASAPPVNRLSPTWLPAAPLEFLQDIVPLPANALAEGLIVAFQVAVIAPVILHPRRSVQECGTQTIQRLPVNGLPVHGAASHPTCGGGC